MFPGFFRPKSNFYRLPNDWFDIWTDVRRMTGRSRILALLKIVEYVIKWTWGYQNYDEPIRISRRDFHRGRRKGGRLLDRGTKLSSRSIEMALKLLVKLGLIEVVQEDDDDGPSFIPRLRPEEENLPEFLCDDVPLESDESSYQGFDLPKANFFIVPAIWTDLTSDIDSEVEILTVEYFFRHTWGWQGAWDEPCWMDVDDIADGRQYRSQERRGERYDQGIGYSVKYTRNALNDAVSRGWLVWREKKSGRGREYALHLKGMNVSNDGQFLYPDDETSPQPRKVEMVNVESIDVASNSEETHAAVNDESTDTANTKIARLQAQVATLTQMVETLIEVLHKSGVDVSIVHGDESTGMKDESKAGRDESKAPKDESKAPKRAKYSTYYTDTGSDTCSKTPPPDTPARTTATNSGDDNDGKDGGGGGGVVTSSVKSLINRLVSLETPMSPDTASDLISTYGEQPVHAWLDVLEHDPTVRSVPALLIHKLREGETSPSKPRRNHQWQQGSTIRIKPPAEDVDDETQMRQRAALAELRRRQREREQKQKVSSL